ncbi:MAG: hypothetical protein ACE5LV_09290 [Candidatus Aminicenantales bacterium]
MERTRVFIPIFLLLLLGAFPLAAQTNEDCEVCHSDPELRTRRAGRRISLYVDFSEFSRSVHGSLECIDCHQDADVEEFPHPERLSPVQCGLCHDEEERAFDASIHGRALKRGAPYAPTCQECHGKHSILPSSQVQSRTYKMNIPVLCGKCHREGAPVARVYNIPERDILSNYSQSIHGQGLFKQGLIVTATCNDCHGNHRILPHIDARSTISAENIARTCAKCHARIEQVHIRVIKGELWEKEPGAIPACTDCHSAHTIREVRMDQFMSEVTHQCGTCHENLSETYLETIHGKA